MYEWFSTVNNKGQPSWKIKDLNRHFSEEEIRMAKPMRTT